MILLYNKIDDFIIQPEGKGVLVVSCWLLVVGCWLLVVGCLVYRSGSL